MKRRLDKAVKDGDLTRKQADNILACFDGESATRPSTAAAADPGRRPADGRTDGRTHGRTDGATLRGRT